MRKDFKFAVQKFGNYVFFLCVFKPRTAAEARDDDEKSNNACQPTGSDASSAEDAIVANTV